MTKINKVRKNDPTKTIMLRKSFVAQFHKRFMAISKAMTTSIVANDCFGLKPANIRAAAKTPEVWKSKINPLPYNSFKYDTNPEKITKFMKWMHEMQREGIFQMVSMPTRSPGIINQWTDLYISRAYKKGMIWARTQIRSDPTILKSLGIPKETIPSHIEHIERSFASVMHSERVGVLYTRTFGDLSGITAKMDAQISRILAEGLSLGKNPIVMARELARKVQNIGIRRATLLARTEVIRAHHVAAIQTYRGYGILNVKVDAEWSTAGDSKVCQICAPLEGKIYTLDEVEPLIPAHPQCRCAALPSIIE